MPMLFKMSSILYLNIKSNSMLMLFFQIHEVTHEILGDGIYPAVSLQSTGDQFKLKNFYAETNQIWDLVERKKEEKLIVSNLYSKYTLTTCTQCLSESDN